MAIFSVNGSGFKGLNTVNICTVQLLSLAATADGSLESVRIDSMALQK